MFSAAKEFNQDISNWNTSKVSNMWLMFGLAQAFEGKGLEKWNVEKVTNMKQMFQNASSFNADISKWNPKSLTNGEFFI